MGPAEPDPRELCEGVRHCVRTGRALQQRVGPAEPDPRELCEGVRHCVRTGRAVHQLVGPAEPDPRALCEGVRHCVRTGRALQQRVGPAEPDPRALCDGVRHGVRTGVGGPVRVRGLPALAVVSVSVAVVTWIGWRWWPHWGLAFAAEEAPLAWWQAALLVANATAAAALATVLAASGARRAAVRAWLLLAVGFVFAALDERFMAHEAAQDWLEFDLGVGRTVARGVILVYALGGLLLLRTAWTQGSAALRRWTAAALLAGLGAIVLDLAFDTLAMQVVEEGLEALAETLLLAGVFSELGSVANRRR